MQKLIGIVMLRGNPTAESVERAIYLVRQKIQWANNPVSLSIYHMRGKSESGPLSMQYLSVQIEDEDDVSKDTMRATLGKIDYFMSGYFSNEKIVQSS
jgi:hypothetical protein